MFATSPFFDVFNNVAGIKRNTLLVYSLSRYYKITYVSTDISTYSSNEPKSTALAVIVTIPGLYIDYTV